MPIRTHLKGILPVSYRNKAGASMEKKVGIQYNSKLFVQGCILALLGVAGPAIIMESRLGIYETLRAGMMEDRASFLIIAALKLVMMNVICAVPHYLGAFLINESVHIYLYGKKRFAFNIVFTLSLIVLIYDVIYRIYGIRYDLGIPALLLIGFVLQLSYMNLFSVSMLNKLLLVASLLMSIQWLDVIPHLSDYGFGRGEISRDVKIAASIMEEKNLLTVFAMSMFLAFLYASLIQVQLLYKEHKLKISNEKTMQVEKELHQTQMEALKLRNSSEVQSLVHDLKSPLTIAQGLVSLAEMMEKDELIQEYFKKISSSLISMNMMISEILYEDRYSPIMMEDLMKMVLAQVSILVPREMLDYEITCPRTVINGNKIRLSRAIINLITNAYNAVSKETGKIHIMVEEKETFVNITVTDNGSGIEAGDMEHIWDLGYSDKQSTGLGLPFVRQVIENHKGAVHVESEKNHYTKVIVCLRKGEQTDGECEDNPGDR